MSKKHFGPNRKFLRPIVFEISILEFLTLIYRIPAFGPLARAYRKKFSVNFQSTMSNEPFGPNWKSLRLIVSAISILEVWNINKQQTTSNNKQQQTSTPFSPTINDM